MRRTILRRWWKATVSLAFGPVFSAFSLRAMAASTMLFLEWFTQLGMLGLIPTRLG